MKKGWRRVKKEEEKKVHEVGWKRRRSRAKEGLKKRVSQSIRVEVITTIFYMRRDRIASSLKNGYFMQGKICYYYDTVHGTKTE